MGMGMGKGREGEWTRGVGMGIGMSSSIGSSAKLNFWLLCEIEESSFIGLSLMSLRLAGSTKLAKGPSSSSSIFSYRKKDTPEFGISSI